MSAPLPLNCNTTSDILVRGIQSGTQFYLPPFWLGQTVTCALQALAPTGNPATPFTQQTITSAAVSLNLITAAGPVSIAVNSAWTTENGILTGTLSIPATGVLTTPAQMGICSLAIDMVINSVDTHMEAACVVRVPAFAITPPLTYANFMGPAGLGVPAGGTANQVLGKIDGTDYNTQWVTLAGSQLFITTGKTFTVTNTLTLAGTDNSTLNIGTGGTLGTAAYVAIDTDASMAANSATRVPAQSAVVSYIASLITGVLNLKGAISATANPNYPAGAVGDLYYITTAGKIGGSAGVVVEVGDSIVCITANAGGAQSSVGADWIILQANIPGLTTVGLSIAAITTPGVASFIRINTDGSVTPLSAANMQAALGPTYYRPTGSTLTVNSVVDTLLQVTTVAGASLATTPASQSISASAIDWSTGNVFRKTLGANTTFTFSNAADGQTIIVALTNTTSNYTVTWPTVKWVAGTAPTQTVGAHTDVYTFVNLNGTIYGSAVQNF